MKYKKWLVFITILMLFSIKTIYADTKINYVNLEANIVTHKFDNTNPNPNFGSNGVNPSNQQLNCSQLFDQSIIDLVNDVLKYPKYIVPIILVVLGTLDLLKAVMADKEDEMKKAQKTFMKRIIIGALAFLVPLLINAIMWLANLAWQGLGLTTCSL